MNPTQIGTGLAPSGISMARRRYQSGSVLLQGSNWYGRYREDVIGPDGHRRRVRRSVVLGSKKDYPTERLARRLLEVYLAPINSLSYRPGRVATLSEFVEKWKTEILAKRKLSTQHSAKAHLRNQILPILGNLKLTDVGVENQQVFVTRISASVSRRTVIHVLSTLSSILTTAQNWGYPCEGVKFRRLALPEKPIPHQPACFSASTVVSILKLAKGQFRVMFAIAAMMGLRAGEILALQKDDLDLTKNLLTVRRSVWRKKISTPKTHQSQAVIPIPEVLAAILREHVNELKTEWLFLNNRGGLFIAENVVRQELAPILDELKIPRCGFHAFRHAHSTILLEGGASPTVVQRQLRHSDARTTLEIYGHLIDSTHRQAIEKLASQLS
jgi:integrase